MTMPAYFRWSDEAGFTLAELLVALALLAMISLLAANGLSFGARVWERGYSTADKLDETVALQRFFRRTISEIYPYTVNVDLQTRYVDFVGEAGRMRFVAPALPQMPQAGLTRYEIRTRSSASFGKLVMRWCALDQCPLEADFFNRAKEAVIADGIKRVQFRYGADDQVSRDWQMTWVNQSELPDRVEVVLTYGKEDRGDWPVLVAAPRVDKDARCVFDPISKRCRER